MLKYGCLSSVPSRQKKCEHEIGKQCRKNVVSMQRIREVMNMGKMIVPTFSDSEETVFQRAVSLLADELQIEAEQQPVPLSVLSFLGLEILQHQRRVLLDRRDAPYKSVPFYSLFPVSNFSNFSRKDT